MLTEYVVVDLEMTGLKPSRDKILEIGAVFIKNGTIQEEFQIFINPGRKIPENIVELTGITDEMVSFGVPVAEAMEKFLVFAGEYPLIGHNIKYDYEFLKYNVIQCGFNMENLVIDTLKISRILLKEPEKKSLDSLCEYFQIRREKEHRALEDAKATAILFEILRKQFYEKHEEMFLPKVLVCKMKKQQPATAVQKKYLKELQEYYRIESQMNLDLLTRSEASRLTDHILFQYGKPSYGEKKKEQKDNICSKY